MNGEQVDKMLKQMILKDLRIQCRARGLSPAGSKETLEQRLKENMLATNDFAMKDENGQDVATGASIAGVSSEALAHGSAQNNYNRQGGQNVGNFLTDRPTSRVLAAPGGQSSISFGEYKDTKDTSPSLQRTGSKSGSFAERPMSASTGPGGLGSIGGANGNNNYARPGGQNVGNFLTDRNSSRVLAPPGGASSITFG